MNSDYTFTLLKGSVINKCSDNMKNSHVMKVKKLRNELENNNQLSGLEVISDIKFKNQGQISNFIIGNSSNAWREIKDKNGVTIDKLCRMT